MRKFLKLFTGLLVILLAIVAAGGFYVYQQFLPAQPSQTTKAAFVVPRGQSITMIGQRLQEKGLIKNYLAFRAIVWGEKLSGKIQAGSFMISPDMSVADIARELTTGTNDVWITVLEGWRVEEIADMLSEQELDSFDKQQFLDLAKNQEGYLFPDSYLIPRSATAATIYNLMRNTFDKKVTQGLSNEIAASGKNLSNLVTFASIVQREAREFGQMKLVAGILQNRLDKGMGLDVDATLQYAKGYDDVLKTWWPQPLAADRNSSSLFNTYKFVGLPPHPICSPGLEAIQAVLTPQKSANFYYLHDRQGNIHVAATLEGHNQNINTYLH